MLAELQHRSRAVSAAEPVTPEPEHWLLRSHCTASAVLNCVHGIKNLFPHHMEIGIPVSIELVAVTFS